ncbi:MAG: NAD(P)-binding domain-containing protein [candidate division KSB1 bacterium]|nr:NAD(P)-binding domain-containing protein [candidate division KSB1 bacterium]MDZ7275556.1 NAD(P)-binding domain-containing protein [candidate division KSB1 bacterium]MDZ7286132.1 NAD(P)-binding domain-containing protein [candidate division KSB1 bacterium]MDZ7296358.1 NAD(P)-binding domain-containing protein [candidate division KSB1 bacterium]MDZ7307134.1 NAD(P)-binding domain-containing protein [candidate division KSB1 bacterium]
MSAWQAVTAVNWPARLRAALVNILHSGSGMQERPLLDKHHESNIAGLYVVGDLAGAPVIKYAMAQGYEVIEHIAALPQAIGGSDPGLYDVIVIGAGAAGLNAALQAAERGMRYLLLEKEKIANTIENFPEGKYVYAEPDSQPPKGKLWLDGATKEDLIRRWHEIIAHNRLNVHTEEGVTGLEKRDGIFWVKTAKAVYRSKRVVLATGQRGNPRRLKVPGEEQEHVYHRLYSPRHYQNENLLVVGGGNSAVEAAITLSEQNKVYLSYRRGRFERIFKDNERQLEQAIAAGRIEPILHSQVKEFGAHEATLIIEEDGRRETRRVPFDHAFVLIGAEVPRQFLKSLGLKMENEWEGSLARAVLLTLAGFLGLAVFGASLGGQVQVPGVNLSALPGWSGALLWALSLGSLIFFGARGDRFAWLGLSFFVWYTVYGAKVGKGEEFWPFQNWGYEFLSFFNRPWSFWYTVLYTALMTFFGLQALKRWGLDHKDKFQIWRYVSLLSFQWIFFFLIPEFLFQLAVKYQWVGERLAGDPAFAGQAWRSYGLVYAWPLFFYTFFYNPHQVWVVWGVLLTFVIIPIFVLFHGKRYCSWICGCGGLAETFGDRWRHLAPKGRTSIHWEWMNLAVLIFAALVTVLMLLKDVYSALRGTAELGISLYRIYADVWLVGILPVTLYPFLGGKIWCRYWCPLAKLMHLQSALFSRLKLSRFKILANDKCIGCYECSRNCQVGIDVMSYALKQQVLDNATSSCIGCGICVTVCPMDTLSFRGENGHAPVLPVKLTYPRRQGTA